MKNWIIILSNREGVIKKGGESIVTEKNRLVPLIVKLITTRNEYFI